MTGGALRVTCCSRGASTEGICGVPFSVSRGRGNGGAGCRRRPGLTEGPLCEGLESRALLTRFTPARLVEEELPDLDRLGVLRGPTWRHLPLMEIQRAARSIGQLKVERLACDLLGGRVRLVLLRLIGTAVTPPRELAGTLFPALPHNVTNRV